MSYLYKGMACERSTHTELSHSTNNEVSANSVIRPRSVLTEEKVLEIFAAGKLCSDSSIVKLKTRGQILALSRKYDVTPKTIRDIWNRRTWKNVTSFVLDTQKKARGSGASSEPVCFQSFNQSHKY